MVFTCGVAVLFCIGSLRKDSLIQRQTYTSALMERLVRMFSTNLFILLEDTDSCACRASSCLLIYRNKSHVQSLVWAFTIS